MNPSGPCKIRGLNAVAYEQPGKGGAPYCRFANLTGLSGFVHGIFTRRGGESRAPFDSLNVGLGVGDQPDAVSENRRRVAASLGMDRLVYLHQVHGDGIRVIKGRQGRLARQEGDADPMVGDAMVTNVPGVCLGIQVADCQAVVLYDAERKVVANIHSGWRGSIANIIGRTVETMAAEFGCDPAGMLAGVGPSLGPCCGEFKRFRQEIPEKFWSYRVSEDHFDFWAISRDQLIRAGLAGENITVTGCCTKCHPELFFSYRGERVTGRFVVAAGLSR